MADLIIEKRNLSQKVLDDFAAGESISKIARKYGLKFQNVSYFLDKQESERTSEWLEAVKRKGIKVFDQLNLLYKKASDMLIEIDDIIKELPPIYRLKAFKETRETMRLMLEQIKVYVNTQKDLYSFYNIKRFQEEVLKAIAEESPETAEKISRKLREKKEIKELVEPVE